MSELSRRGGLWLAISLVSFACAVHFDLHKTSYVFYLFSALFFAIALSAFKFFGIRAALLVVLFCGAFYVKNAPIYSPIDELGHFGYVHHIAKHGRLPLLHDYLDDEMLAFAKKTYPQPTDTQVSDMGLAGRYYQAFQPPLYYLLAVPMYSMAGDNLHKKVYMLRALGLVLLVIALYVALRAYELLVTHKVIDRDDFLFFSVLLLLTITPGILNRMTTVSNLQLQVPMASLFLYFLIKYRLEDRNGAPSVWVPSVLCGLAVLTQFISVFLVAVLLVHFLLQRRFVAALLSVLVVLLVVSPWLAFNVVNYGSLTANALAREMQQYVVNPGGSVFTLVTVLDSLPLLVSSLWISQDTRLDGYSTMVSGFLGVVTAMALTWYAVSKMTGSLTAWFGFAQRAVLLLTGLTVMLNIVVLFYVAIFEQFMIVHGRYLYMSQLALAVVLYTFLRNAGRSAVSVLCVALANLMYVAHLHWWIVA